MEIWLRAARCNAQAAAGAAGGCQHAPLKAHGRHQISLTTLECPGRPAAADAGCSGPVQCALLLLCFCWGRGNSLERLDPQSCRCLVHPIESVMQHQRLRSLRWGLPAPPCRLAAPSFCARQPISWRRLLVPSSSLGLSAYVENTSRECIAAATQKNQAGRYSVCAGEVGSCPSVLVFDENSIQWQNMTLQQLQHTRHTSCPHKPSDSHLRRRCCSSSPITPGPGSAA